MDLNAGGDHTPTVFGFPLPPFPLGVVDQPGHSISSQSQSASPEKSTQKSRPTSGIPKLKSSNGKSVIYGPSAHHKNGHSSQQNLSQFKSPWVPAPGLATGTSIATTQTHARVKNGITSSRKIMQFRNGSAPPHTHSESGLGKNCDPPFVVKTTTNEKASNNSIVSAASYPIHHRRKTRIKKSKSSSSRSQDGIESWGRDQERGILQLQDDDDLPKSERGILQLQDDDDLPKSERSLSKENPGKSTSYTLKSTDSLADVTSFLACKRDEIKCLWENCLAEGDHPELLTMFENANHLANEAVNEVENLRQSIARLHEKETSLSEGDCELLDQQRQRVLVKIKNFEQVNSKVQNEVGAATIVPGSGVVDKSPKSQDNLPPKSTSFSRRPKAKYSKSSTNIHHQLMHGDTVPLIDSARVNGQNDIFFIKEKSPTFHNFPPLSDSSTDVDIGKQFQKTYHQSPIPAKATFSATTVPSSTIVDLSKLTRMYNEGLELPPVSCHAQNFNQSKNVRFQNEREQKLAEVETLQTQLASLIQYLKINQEQHPTNKKTHNSDPESTIDDDDSSYRDHQESANYRSKVLKLQRKMNDAEAEMEELKEDLERVESDSNFKVRLLKSSFEDRLDNVESFPEYLHIMDMKLMETIQSRAELEKVVQHQHEEMNKLQTANVELRKELNNCQKEIKGVENSVSRKLQELEKVNEELSEELRQKNEDMAKLTRKLSTMPKQTSNFTRTFSSIHQNLNESPEMNQLLQRNNNKLEVKIEELRDRLAKAHKNVHILQVTKEKMQSRLHQRQEELLSELEASRARNRQLQNQIHYIRTTYHDLFPMEAFYPKAHTSHDRPVKTQRQTLPRKRSTLNPDQSAHATTEPNASRQSSEIRKSQPQQFTQIETLISQTKSWVTGQKAGGDKNEEIRTDKFINDGDAQDNPTANPSHDGESTTVSELEDPSES